MSCVLRLPSLTMQDYFDIWSKRPVYLPFKDMQTLLACYFTTFLELIKQQLVLLSFLEPSKKLTDIVNFDLFIIKIQQLHLRWQEFYSHNNNMKIKIAVSIKMHFMIRVGGYILLLHIYIESDFVVKCSLSSNFCFKQHLRSQ